MKWLFFIPRRAASRFITCTNTSSLPATASASAMQASLPDWITIPRISSSTFTGRRGWMNMRDPGARQARSETFTCWPRESFLSRSAVNTTYAVMILVSEAGSMRSSAFSAASTWLLERSPTSQDLPMTFGGAAGAACAARMKRARNRRRRCMDLPKKERIIEFVIGLRRAALADHQKGLQVQFALDALCDRAGRVVGAVGPAQQPPQTSGRQHLNLVGQPGELARHLASIVFCVLPGGERPDLQIDRRLARIAGIDALYVDRSAACLDIAEPVGRGVRKVDDPV